MYRIWTLSSLIFLLTRQQVDAFVLTTPTRVAAFDSASSRIWSESDDTNNEEPEVIQSSTVKINDGGSNLTDRFKYKVHALMGDYDPTDASKDTEESSGNILSAMMNFPTMYTFHVVGKHTAGDETEKKTFVRSVQTIVRKGAGLRDDAPLEADVIPRSSKFLKVSVSVTVESGTMIAEIYEELGSMPECVMKF